jgi:hypothetical protein
MKVEMQRSFGTTDMKTGKVINHGVLVALDDADDAEVTKAKKILANFTEESIEKLKEAS